MAGESMEIAAQIVPSILIGIIGYTSWVITHVVVHRNFFNVDILGGKRVGGGIVILVIYWILFVLVTWSFFRMLWAIFRHPGYIERGHAGHVQAQDEEKAKQTSKKRILPERLSFARPRLGDIISKDIFVCQTDGLPSWCDTCKIWRPDRSRHCREKDRCVLKLDHFCPWVGGIVSEQVMKYFILFNSYTFLYTIFDWILAAICIAQRKQQLPLNGNLIAMLIFGLFFMGLTGGIGLSAIVNALTNHTTKENLAEPAGHTWNMALRVANSQVVDENVRTVSFPDLDDCDFDTLQKLVRSRDRDQSQSSDPDPGQQTPEAQQTSNGPFKPGHTFAIVESDLFLNPWDCGMYENWCQVMGHNVLGWFLPLDVGGSWLSRNAYAHQGPGRPEAGDQKSFFPAGLDIKVMKARAGLTSLTSEEERDYNKRIQKRKAFPYLLGGAGAPLKQWAASRAR